MLSRRDFIARLARSGVAVGVATVIGPARTVLGAASLPASAGRLAPSLAANMGDQPIRVRIGEVVQSGADFRAGLAEGVGLPGQGGALALAPTEPGGRYTSAPLGLAFPCSHVGTHWQIDGGDGRGLLVELRTSPNGSRWSGWRPVAVEAHGRAEHGIETFGALQRGRAGAWLQYRLTFPEGWPPDTGISQVALTYLDAGTTPPNRLGASRDGVAFSKLAAGPVGFLGRVIPREAWGADESLRFVDGKDQWPRAYVAPKLTVVHHTATDNTYDDPAAEVRAIYVYHTITQGFGDIGYHLLIDNRGQAFEGRLGRDPDPDAPWTREILSRDIVAGHTYGYNYGSVGIAMLGNFVAADPSEPALQTLEEALAFTAARYWLDPLERIDVLRSRRPTGEYELWRDGLNAVSGHRDCFPTECPGDRLYSRLPALRQQAAQRTGPAGPRVHIEQAPPGRNPWPSDLLFGWTGVDGGAEFSTRLEGWRLSSEPDRIVALSGYAPGERPVWSPWTAYRGQSFALPPDAYGHYTLHVRARMAGGSEGTYAARWPLFVDRHVIADDADSALAVSQGAWTRTDHILGYNASGYLEAEPESAIGAASVAWTLDVPEDGEYRVMACWTDGEYRATNARYTIAAGSQTLATTDVSQRENGGLWVDLARVPLRAGVHCQVTLTNAADGVVVADAVRIVLVE
ncbi:MAG: N-acetylmuramoyl-L-alanine amidase [Chloroflexi bacterium]|nr:N-acetylmuramoyl-L-alanine amidase [Chloroflexota bacterium]